jgi:hypothetical protein
VFRTCFERRGGQHGGEGRLQAAVSGRTPLHCCLTCTAGVSRRGREVNG